jgi:hypothetical protein
MEEIRWEDFECAQTDFYGRPWRQSETSSAEWSQDFRVKSAELESDILRELELDYTSLMEEIKAEYSAEDGDIFYALLSRIFQFDIFEHEGEDRYLILMTGIARSVEAGEFLYRNILCYGEDRLVDLRFCSNRIEMAHKPNPGWSDTNQ